MLLQKKIHLTKLDNDREVVERLVDENITGKLDSYLKKYKEGTKCSLVVTIGANKKGNFNGSVQLDADGLIYRAEREDYKKLDDLINHLFDHVKEQLSKNSKGWLGRLRGAFASIVRKVGF
jgi:hypothetical protein